LIDLVLDSGCIPIVMPAGTGQCGEIVDLDADDVAAELALALKAETLVLMTNAPGIVDREGTLLNSVSIAGLERLFDDGAVCEGWRRKLGPAQRAVRNGVNSVHVINGRVPSALLLELPTGDRLGTLIVSKHAMRPCVDPPARLSA